MAERQSVVLVGANPGVRLRAGDDVTAFASVWQVDWSERGSADPAFLAVAEVWTRA